jgi:UPF0755 protein
MLILSSIVEREVRLEKDRPVVAGILIKRWRSDWPLQADATIQYLKADLNCRNRGVNCDWWEPVSGADLDIDSPYNSYLYRGLVPGPICNPGLASIQAVSNPQDTDYWFYLSDYSGEVHYARTNEEHSENIERYLR